MLGAELRIPIGNSVTIDLEVQIVATVVDISRLANSMRSFSFRTSNWSLQCKLFVAFRFVNWMLFFLEFCSMLSGLTRTIAKAWYPFRRSLCKIWNLNCGCSLNFNLSSKIFLFFSNLFANESLDSKATVMPSRYLDDFSKRFGQTILSLFRRLNTQGHCVTTAQSSEKYIGCLLVNLLNTRMMPTTHAHGHLCLRWAVIGPLKIIWKLSKQLHFSLSQRQCSWNHWLLWST